MAQCRKPPCIAWRARRPASLTTLPAYTLGITWFMARGSCWRTCGNLLAGHASCHDMDMLHGGHTLLFWSGPALAI